MHGAWRRFKGLYHIDISVRAKGLKKSVLSYAEDTQAADVIDDMSAADGTLLNVLYAVAHNLFGMKAAGEDLVAA